MKAARTLLGILAFAILMSSLIGTPAWSSDPSVSPLAAEVVRDPKEIRLHNSIWGGINHGGLIESPFRAEDIYDPEEATYDWRWHYGAYYDFIVDVPLSNGHYKDIEAAVYGDNLRAWGQKDTVNKRAHLWIQNTEDTWLKPHPAPSRSGAVVVEMPPGNYIVQRWDTWATEDRIMSSESIISENGSILIDVQGLTRDFAVKLQAAPNEPPHVAAFEQGEGSGALSEWVDFTAAFTDTNGAQDLRWAYLYLDNAAEGSGYGLTAVYDHRTGIFSMPHTRGCFSGDTEFLDAEFVILDCRWSVAIASGETLSVTWSVGWRECPEGGCGTLRAQGSVRDAWGMMDERTIGYWTLNPWVVQ